MLRWRHECKAYNMHGAYIHQQPRSGGAMSARRTAHAAQNSQDGVPWARTREGKGASPRDEAQDASGQK